jgi:ubiquinone biosynthesis protein COQ9
VLLDSIENKNKILAEFVKISAFDGWNKDSLRKALKNCNFDENYGEIIFENGLIELADFYIEQQNLKSAELISQIADFSSEKIRNKIKFFLYARLEVEVNNKMVLQQLFNFYINPKNFLNLELGSKPIASAIKSCYKIADFIWESINDSSTDFNFYTKRLTLAKIILRSFFIFLKDESKNFIQTRKFIDSQIEKVMNFEQFKRKIKNFIEASKENSKEILLDENNNLKSFKEIFSNLPFIRLFKP